MFVFYFHMVLILLFLLLLIFSTGLEKMVVDNNAFLFAQSLLSCLKNAAEYARLQEHRQIETLIETIVIALSTHPDPPEFIITALITVGNVAGFKNMDPEFELSVSTMLVESLQRYLAWQRDLIDDREDRSSGSSPLEYQGDDGDDDDGDDEDESNKDGGLGAMLLQLPVPKRVNSI